MAASATAGLSNVTDMLDASAAAAGSARRCISPEAGRALEILGHAIEYLIDEYVNEGGSFSPSDPQVQAVHLLMALNRQVYFACPVVPGFGERVRSFLRWRTR
jgi:hypothetical protein